MQSHIVLGSLCILVGEMFFVSMGMSIKTLAQSLNNEHIVFFRNLIALAFILPLLLSGGFKALKTQKLPLHFLRALTGVLAMYCFFYAIGNLILADAMLLKLTGPLFIPIFAFLVLQEKSGWKTISGILIGFVGVIIILKPTGQMHLASLVGVLGGALAAFAKIIIRKMKDTESTLRTVFYFAFFSTLLSLLPATLNWQWPNSTQWMLLALTAAAGTAGQICLTQAYRMAPASEVGPFTYVSLIYASIAGWLFWQETLPLSTIIGSLFIVAAGLLILYSAKTQSLNSAAGIGAAK